MLQIFTKKEAVGVWGKKPEERTPQELLDYGITNIDKPKGPTSHQCSDYVKKILHLSKAGHSGTLDPNVVGVQPIALGRSTRIVHFLLTSPKEYIGIMHLHQEVEESTLQAAVQKFIGKIQQLPPVKSAVKRELRTREIYEFEVLEIKEKDILFRVKCQAGTYIRKLCTDLAKELGVGGHMAELRRTQAGPFTENDHLVTLNDVEDAYHYHTEENNSKYLHYCIQPIELAIAHVRKCWVLDTTIETITHGRDLAVPGISKLENFRKGEQVVILSLKGEIIAAGEALMSAVEINTKQKGIAIKVGQVFR